MDKEFVPHELALELKQLGFDEPCLGYYIASTLFISNDTVYNSTDISVIKAPLFQQSFRWFREKYDLYADIYRIGKKFNAGIEDMNIGSSKETVVEGVDYEEAELACLKKLIELVKN